MKTFKRFVCVFVLFLSGLVYGVFLTDPQLYIDPWEVPYDYYDRVYLDDLSVNNTYTWASDGDDIIDADILPVLKEGPGPEGSYPSGYVFNQADYYQTPNVDYFADLTNGDLTVTFLVSAQYNVRIHRASGSSKIWTVFAETGMLEIGNNATGASRKISGPTGDVIIVAEGDKTLDKAAKNIQGEGKKVTRAKGIKDTIAKINAASKAAGKKVHVEIVGHGAPGMISTNDGSTADDNLIGPDEADIKEFQKAIDGSCSGLSLFSCSSAKGAAGDKLLKLLASSLGWASGYTVPITVEDGYFNLELTAVKTLMLDTETVSPVDEFHMDVDIGEFSISADSIPVEIDGIVYPSGELLFTPDYDYPPEENYVTWNFADGSVVESLHVLVGCPLFIDMDIPSQKLHLLQWGPPGTVNVVSVGGINPTLPSDIEMIYNNPLINESAFDPNQLFTDWTFEYSREIMAPENTSVVVQDSQANLLNLAAPIIRQGSILTASMQPPMGGLPPLFLIHDYIDISAVPDLLGDLDYDKDVDLEDFAVFAGNWLKGID